MFYLKIFFTIVIAVMVCFLGLELLNQKRNLQYAANAYLIEGLSISGQVKAQIDVYFSINGEFPSSNQQLGIASPEQYRGQSLTSLHVSEAGIITLTYNKKSGVHNGVIQLKPEPSDTIGIRWQCRTPNYQSLSPCEYNQQLFL
ncbi:pilin [Agarivorans sp. MS3-6]|uniref:pilin n=1 Tax=Agarivorans sp. TSD2052 TaxID=2937286 RepID=UPI00201041AB|nr:pilin [Agarivorans sp. TSD2052]UPW16884.1 pilin [Agarivorans sp. TSD2052]